jgi:hypothetical protein
MRFEVTFDMRKINTFNDRTGCYGYSVFLWNVISANQNRALSYAETRLVRMVDFYETECEAEAEAVFYLFLFRQTISITC